MCIVISALAFPALSYVAFKILHSPTLQSAFFPWFGEHTAPNRLSYTGVDSIDYVIALLVTFFIVALDRDRLDVRLHTLQLLASSPAVATVVTMDASARFKSTTISILMPLATGILSQTLGGATIYPIYFLVSYLTFLYRSQSSGFIDKRRSEAVLLGILIGAVVPTLVLVYDERIPTRSAVWQGYPVLVSIIQSVYLAVKPRARSTKRSGVSTANYALAMVTLLISVVTNVTLISQHSISYLAKSATPPYPEPSFTSDPRHGPVTYFLKWDGLIIFASTYLFMTITIPNITFFGIIGALVWSLVGPMLLGGGGCLAALLAYKEFSTPKGGKPEK